MRSPVCWNSPADRLVLPLSVGGVGNISHAEIMRQAQIDFGFGRRAADPLPLTMIVDAVARA